MPSPVNPPKHIVILGGGITGLTSAFHISRRCQTSLITVLEKEHRLGGWINSETVHVTDAEGRPAKMLLETGPRTLRPGAKGVMELVGLQFFVYPVSMAS
jgi:oxygen-dependent protoporphyrinogen oxidase